MSETKAVYPAIDHDSHEPEAAAATRTVDVQYVDGGRRKPLPYPLDEEPAAAIDTESIRSLFAELLLDASHDYHSAWVRLDDAAHYRRKVAKDWDAYEARMMARLDALLKGEG